jgi:hypothetical protein
VFKVALLYNVVTGTDIWLINNWIAGPLNDGDD